MSRSISIDKLIPWFQNLLDEFQSAPIVPAILDSLRTAAELNFEENFLNAVDANGTPWPPHSPATVAAMGEHDLLIWQQNLLKSLTLAGSFGSTESYDDFSYSRGTDIIYAKTQNYGRPGGGWWGSDIPAREFCYINEKTAAHVLDVASDFYSSLLTDLFNQGEA